MKKKTLKQLQQEIKRLRFENTYKDSQIDLLIDNQAKSHEEINQVKNIQEDYIEAFKHIRKMEEIRANEKSEKTKGMFSVMPIILQTATEFFKSLKKEKINPPAPQQTDSKK